MSESPGATGLLKSLHEQLGLSEEQIQDAYKIVSETDSAWEPGEDGNPPPASVHQLIHYLVRPEGTDGMFMQQFFYCLPSFTGPEFVLGAFLALFYNENDTTNNDATTKADPCRILKVIRRWTEITPWQFTPAMVDALRQIKEALEPDRRDMAAIAQNACERISNTRKRSVQFSNEPPEMILPNEDPVFWTVTMIPPIELARQLTLLHSELFAAVSCQDLVAEVWRLQRREEETGLARLSEHFNAFSNFVSVTTIVWPNLNERVRVHSFWIDVGIELMKLSNYHGLFAVICGLTHQCVNRLKELVKRSVKSTKERQTGYEDLLKVCDFTNNYENYRKIKETLKEPCVPFLGTFQKDLIYVNESYPNFVDGCVNFKKCVETSKLIMVIRKFQHSMYNLKKHSRIQELISAELPEPRDTPWLMKLSQKRQ